MWGGSPLSSAGDGARRLGTMEIECVLVSHPAVAEAAVVGPPDELKGEGIVAIVNPGGRPQRRHRPDG
jgi:acyl-coenzyme A synthetase/AMP-(fatty) acid ligase